VKPSDTRGLLAHPARLHEEGLPLTFRSGGTSLSCQADAHVVQPHVRARHEPGPSARPTVTC
jgi:hypothetical protein